MKPRIVILSAFLTPFRSGAEACAEEVPLRLADQCDFTIITGRYDRRLPKNDRLRSGIPTLSEVAIPVIRVGVGHPIDKWLFPFIAPFVVRKLKPDIIHGILETFAGLALYFCRYVCPTAKRALTLQTTNRSFFKGPIIRSAHFITAISKVLAEIAKSLGRNDVTIIPNGIHFEAIRAACERYPKVPGRVLFVGRLEWMKGVDTTIKAFIAFHQKHPSHVLHVVGSGSLFAELGRQYGALPFVKINGALGGQSLLQEYAEAEVFCGLSRSEALGNVFLEAQAAGCVVIATNVGGIPDIVQDKETGFLISPDDVGAAAAALEDLTQKRVQETIARNGPKHAAHYDWKLIANRYAQIYKSITLS